MNTIEQEQFEALKECFRNGGSIRDGMHIAQVAKHTAVRYRRLYLNAELPRPRLVERGTVVGDCRAISQPERKAIWERMGNEIPDGQRLGWICQIPYCGDPEHMQLLENKNSRHNNWKPYLDAVRVLEIGEYCEFPRTMSIKDMDRLRTNLTLNARVYCSIRTSKDGKTFRIYRTGTWGFEGGSYESASEVSRSIPVEYFGGQRPMPPTRPHCGYLGLIAFESLHSSALDYQRCCERGCAFPAGLNGKCHRHEHFFEYKWSMEWRQLDRRDIVGTEEQPIPLLSSMQWWELTRSAERTIFHYKGSRDKGRKISDDYWTTLNVGD